VRRLIALPVALLSAAGCYHVASRIGQDASPVEGRAIDPRNDVALPEGHALEAIAIGLTFPAGITFDDRGRPYVIEAGYSYGDAWAPPRLIRLDEDGGTTVIAVGSDAPWTGVDFSNGVFYVASNGAGGEGRILRVGMNGSISAVAVGLPGFADHHLNGPVVGPDGYIYFAQGTATNSAVVGMDNHEFGWLEQRPDHHDIPCRDVKLRGENYETENPLTPDDEDRAITGAFLPFGTPSSPDQIIEGKLPCTGAVMRVRPEGGSIELVAWGFRNPFGLAFSPDGKLYVTDNGYDERGSRPIFGSPDFLWEVDPAGPPIWYGWPDFAGGIPIGDRFDKATMAEPKRLLAEIPNEPPRAKALFGVHASATGIEFARTDHFAPVGAAFVTEFGDMAPDVGRVIAPVGFRVVMVDPSNGVITPFMANVGDQSGPASRLESGGIERPIDLAISPKGTELYIVDFGVMNMGEVEGKDGTSPIPQKNTGVIWRVTRTGAAIAER
jgi:hypothetical protein